jgi:hypothetical protein
MNRIIGSFIYTSLQCLGPESDYSTLSIEAHLWERNRSLPLPF